MLFERDCIAAVATPSGQGGIGVIRLSGGETVHSITDGLINFKPRPRYAHYASFFDAENQIIDQGLVIYFPGPNSYTGENVLEIHGHGSPVLLDQLLKRLTELGARVARPGEFTERAYLNDRMDLAQAEAVADVIEASSRQAAQSAMASLQGEFSQTVHKLVEQLTQLRVYVEGSMDFPEDEVDFLTEGQVDERLQAIAHQAYEVKRKAGQGKLLREGLTVVLAGEPNVGKSSLLNQLTGDDTAIVTDIPGTTRDMLREQIQIDGLPINIVDTAGLRHAGDAVEREGIKRTRSVLQQAHHAILVIDAGKHAEPSLAQCMPSGISAEIFKTLPVTIVMNKIDKIGQKPRYYTTDEAAVISVSALNGEGIDGLKAHLKSIAGFEEGDQGTFTARRRHLEALDKACANIETALAQLRDYRAGELVAEELANAQHNLATITGDFTTEDLLGEIFSSFCIGK